MARQDPGDLLSQLDHEPVGIEEVEGPVPPRPVHRAGEELDAKAPEPLGFGIDVLDEEEDLAGRPAVDGLTVDQVGSTCALEEPEPCLAGDELRIPSIAELESEPDRVPIERRRHIQIADVQDHMADALHGHYRTTGSPQTDKLRELQGSVATIVVPWSWQAVLVGAEMPFRGPVDVTEGGDDGRISTSGLRAVRLGLPRGDGGLPGSRGAPARSRAPLGEGAQAGKARDRDRQRIRGGRPISRPEGPRRRHRARGHPACGAARYLGRRLSGRHGCLQLDQRGAGPGGIGQPQPEVRPAVTWAWKPRRTPA